MHSPRNQVEKDFGTFEHAHTTMSLGVSEIERALGAPSLTTYFKDVNIHFEESEA